MSAFGDAVLAQMTEGLNPQNQMIRDYGVAMIEAKSIEVVDIKARSLAMLNEQLEKAIERSAPPAVIGGIERLIGQVTT